MDAYLLPLLLCVSMSYLAFHRRFKPDRFWVVVQ
jgi:hypothetical protein